VGDFFNIPDRSARTMTSDTRGAIPLRLALIVPGLILLGAGAIDLFAVHTAQSRMQSIADAAALAGAPALPTDAAAARGKAASHVVREMREWSGAPTFQSAYQIVNQGDEPAIRVVIRGQRPSLLANMLPPGGWKFSGDATATSQGLVPRD
jgi:hypothetical protein